MTLSHVRFRRAGEERDRRRGTCGRIQDGDDAGSRDAGRTAPPPIGEGLVRRRRVQFEPVMDFIPGDWTRSVRTRDEFLDRD